MNILKLTAIDRPYIETQVYARKKYSDLLSHVIFKPQMIMTMEVMTS